MSCSECNTRRASVEYVTVKRFGGGNHRRPGRYYRTTVCEVCLRALLESIRLMTTRGYRAEQYSRYLVSSLFNALRALETP